MSSHVFSAVSKRPSTIRSYLKRADDLKKQAAKDLNISDHLSLDPRQLIGWISHRRTQYSSSTWRQYKSSLVCALECELDLLDDRQDPTSWIDAIETLKIIDGNGDAPKTNKTSSMKLKKFPIEDFDTLDTHLTGKKHESYSALRDWLKAGLWTGLRPSEWKDTKLIDINGVPALLVQNAKHSNGRAHGPTRTVILHRTNDMEKDIIIRHLNRVNNWDAAGVYTRMVQSCSNKLYLSVRKIWPKRTKHLTLYSTRHQFVADAKASNLNLSEIAALMGHAVDDTASAHYGKRAAGQSIIKVQALAAEVAKIKQVFSGHPDRRFDVDPHKIKIAIKSQIDANKNQTQNNVQKS